MKTKTSHLKALSTAKQTEIGRLWNKRLRDPFAFVPKQNRGEGLSPTEARKTNALFGKFAAGYLKKTIARITNPSDVIRRQKKKKKIVAVGYGLGYDCMWLREATMAGFQTFWIEVSSIAWIWATTNLNNQFQDFESTLSHLRPMVKTCEIQSLLARPRESELNLASVEIWYLCRLLNCLSTQSAKIVLQEIGRVTLGPDYNSSKRGAVVIINALSDHNQIDPHVGTSIMRSKKMILSNLSRGAGCSVRARFVEHYRYFGKLVTAMTVMVSE